MRELVEEVHSNFTALLAQAKTEREHPIIIKILENLTRLTDVREPGTGDVETGEENFGGITSAASEPEEEPAPSKMFDPPLPGGNFAAQMEREREAEQKRLAEWDESHPKL